MTSIHLKMVREAADRIRGIVRHTPLEYSRWLSQENDQQVYLKLECFQATGSFKLRGAHSKLSLLVETGYQSGILTVSAGNHGLAVAHSAEKLGLEATVVVPENASAAKVEAIRRYPERLQIIGRDYDAAESAALRMRHETEAVFVSPYNDPDVIAGQGTVALEMLEDVPDLQALVVPTGGGGLLAGVAVAAKVINPGIKVYGVEPSASPTMTRALEAGQIIAITEDETLADGLAGNIEAGSMTFPIVQELVDGMVLVTEEQIRNAILRVARMDHRIIEGSAATAIAALSDVRLKGLKVGAIVTGCNISHDLFCRLIA